MQGDDVGVGTYLTKHLDFSLSRERIGSGQHNGKRDLAVSFPIPSTVGLFTGALADQMIDAVAVGEKRALGKRNIHSSQIVALPTDDRIPNKSARAGPDVQEPTAAPGREGHGRSSREAIYNDMPDLGPPKQEETHKESLLLRMNCSRTRPNRTGLVYFSGVRLDVAKHGVRVAAFGIQV